MSEENQNIANEPLELYSQPLTFEKVWLMFQETDKQFKETDKKIEELARESSKRSKEIDNSLTRLEKLFEQQAIDYKKRQTELQKELGGIGKSNGQIAEDFYYTALEKSLQVGKLKFDYIDRNNHRKRNNIEAEYDIVLYNNYKVLIVEVKYNFRNAYLHSFYKNKLKNFTKLYPQYKEYKIYGAIAAMTFEKNVIEEALSYGFYVITQNNDKIRLLNNSGFEPNEIK